MSSTDQTIAAGPRLLPRHLPPPGRGSRRNDRRWAAAFLLPYVAVFLAFVVYPFGYALWMARDPTLYAQLFGDRLYQIAIVNTLLFVGIGVNLKMFLALLLSGYFIQRRWWVKATLAAFVLPWLIATAQACISFHWMLSGRWGLVDGILLELFGIDGPEWLDTRWLAIGSDIVAYTWKWLPFWTVIFLAARLTIPRDVYDAAEVDGASGIRRFIHVTVPLLANLYLLCTLLSVLWTLGDFTTVFLVSNGGPADASQVLATLSYQYAFDSFKPELGVAAALSALPVLIPIVLLLIRRLQAGELRL